MTCRSHGIILCLFVYVLCRTTGQWVRHCHTCIRYDGKRVRSYSREVWATGYGARSELVYGGHRKILGWGVGLRVCLDLCGG